MTKTVQTRMSAALLLKNSGLRAHVGHTQSALCGMPCLEGVPMPVLTSFIRTRRTSMVGSLLWDV